MVIEYVNTINYMESNKVLNYSLVAGVLLNTFFLVEAILTIQYSSGDLYASDIHGPNYATVAGLVGPFLIFLFFVYVTCLSLRLIFRKIKLQNYTSFSLGVYFSTALVTYIISAMIAS